MSERVVITGLGWVTPLGHTPESTWSALLAGERGARQISHFDASTFPTRFAAEVRGFDWRSHVPDPDLHGPVERHTGFVLAAARQAWAQAKLPDLKVDRLGSGRSLLPARAGCYLGAGEGTQDLDRFVAAGLAGLDAGEGRVDAESFVAYALQHFEAAREVGQECNMPVSHVALELGLGGFTSNCLTACAASTQAIGEAVAAIRHGDADVMLAGGAHTMIHPMGVTGFNRLTALSTRNDDPAGASRPFSRDRDGFVMGEGAGVVVLESERHARDRGLVQEDLLAEVAGYGSTADAYRITDIHPDGRGAAAAIWQALHEAGADPQAVDWIAAHGTGTQENDGIETRAIHAVFGENPDAVPPVSSVKSMMGHLIAAAGVSQAIAGVLAIRDGVLPPTMNLDDPDPSLDLDYIANASRQLPGGCDVVLSNSFGFGGQNDTLVLRSVR